MTRILSILRAAHCRSTHHYFALDALQDLTTAQAQRLANILLKYHDDYLVGAKAPDSNFKDFQNHVIHVNDNNWGGAPQKCQEWLVRAREYLDQGKWKKAAYACGVLSHYFTDPMMPLHTAQHPREQVVHRPMEWSICQSYDQIYRVYKESGCGCDFVLALDDQWIGKAVRAAASVANRHYDRLVAIYDIERGVVKPREGLNDEALTILAELFALAIGGLSRVLTRLADETTNELPQVSLTLTSVLATIDMPLAWIVRKISDTQERLAVKAIFAEYQKTGGLKRNLPAEISVVQNSKVTEPTLGIQQPVATISAVAALDAAMNESTANLSTAEITIADQTEVQSTTDLLDLTPESTPELVQNSPAESSLSADSLSARDNAFADSQSLESFDDSDIEPQFVSLSQARTRFRVQQTELSLPRDAEANEAPSVETQTPTSEASMITHESAATQLRIAPGTMLAPPIDDQNTVHYGSPLIEAPSIGPKTAKRFENIGIYTIRQLVSTSPEKIASGLSTRWITVSLIQDWQDQARLVCEVPALSGYRAELLVAVGCRTSWQLRTVNPSLLHGQISQFCQTSEGQQILRSASPPQEVDVGQWVESAKLFARREVA